MELYQAIILGIIQGLTEFLPVSSSGHLVLFQQILGLEEPNLSFDISLHVGTLMAVIIVYFKDIMDIVSAFFRFTASFFTKNKKVPGPSDDPNLKLLYLIVIGTIPTGCLGLLFHNVAEKIFSSMLIVGIMLMITGTILWLTRRFSDTQLSISEFSGKKALIIGFVQGLAVIPGISRSGSTIAAGLFLGFDRQIAAKYSFLLSIPAILAAEILSLAESYSGGINIDMATIVGTAVSFATGYFALVVLLTIVKQGRFFLFSPYCWSIGLLSIFADLFI